MIRNPGPDLEQAQKYGGVKPVNGIPTLECFWLQYYLPVIKHYPFHYFNSLSKQYMFVALFKN